MLNKLTIKQATEKWIDEYMDGIPTALIEKAYNFEEVDELTIYEFNDEEDEDENRPYGFPTWGTMWSFSSTLDNEWLNDEDNRKKMSECGFRIFESDEIGYFFGIDGGGYDFYEQHWIPLYKARGIKWHDEELEENKGDE